MNDSLKLLKVGAEIILDKESHTNRWLVVTDKITHIRHCGELARTVRPEDDMLEIAMLWHDIGRVEQFKNINSFDDMILDHRDLGESFYKRYITTNNIPTSNETDMIADAIKYHGRPDRCQSTFSKGFVKDVSAIDELENGFYGIMRYLEREIRNDEKHYRKNNPIADQRIPTNKVWQSYSTCTNFAKDTLATYADYLLYAASLSRTALKRYQYMMPHKDVQNVIEFYHKMFEKYLEQHFAVPSFNLLQKLN